jgi:electron transport complex protein RnfG
MKSSLKNMVLVLAGIALVCSAAVGLVYKVTLDPITKAEQLKVTQSIAAVLPAFEQTAEDVVSVDGKEFKVFTATDASGAVVGYAFEAYTMNGFSGEIRLMVGFDTEGTVSGIEVLKQAETPGLGANLAKADNVVRKSIEGKKAGELTLKVKKDGGDVDALTAATISSRAYTEVVAAAYEAFKMVNK